MPRGLRRCFPRYRLGEGRKDESHRDAGRDGAGYREKRVDGRLRWFGDQRHFQPWWTVLLQAESHHRHHPVEGEYVGLYGHVSSECERIDSRVRILPLSVSRMEFEADQCSAHLGSDDL